MHGLMQDRPLALPHLFHRAERLFGHKTIVTATADGSQTTSTYADWAQRVRRLAGVLDELGLEPGAKVGSFAWNTQRHLELYFAVPCAGRILHTLNIRLFADQISYIVQDAGDEVIFVDRSVLPTLWPLADSIPSVKYFVVMDDGADAEIPDDPRIRDYETLLAEATPKQGDFEVADENDAAVLCYTSGTTGHPKGVLYSHRSTVLHALTAMTADAFAVSERDVLLPIVPRFHANSWGLPYAGVFAGSTLVFPGPGMAPAKLLALIEQHHVTFTAGVPTIWMGAVPLLHRYDLSSLRMVVAGGSAVPPSLSESWRETIGLPITQAWGMTETSPIGTISFPRTQHAKLSETELQDLRATQGQPVPLVDIRITEPGTDDAAPWDGSSVGELQIAGPWIAGAYLGRPDDSSFTRDGWLRTGDVATVTSDGYMKLVDRVKDLVKSGGEWISSVELENHIMSHPDVEEAAVIARPDAKWSERPVACVVVREGVTLTAEDIIEHLRTRVARWWLPDEVLFIPEIPKTSTGKFSKRRLRQQYYGD